MENLPMPSHISPVQIINMTPDDFDMTSDIMLFEESIVAYNFQGFFNEALKPYFFRGVKLTLQSVHKYYYRLFCLMLLTLSKLNHKKFGYFNRLLCRHKLIIREWPISHFKFVTNSNFMNGNASLYQKLTQELKFYHRISNNKVPVFFFYLKETQSEINSIGKLRIQLILLKHAVNFMRKISISKMICFSNRKKRFLVFFYE